MPAPQTCEPKIAPLELIDLERFFDLSVNMLCIANSDSTFRRVSPAFTSVLGWTAEELCSRPFLAFVHPDDVAPTLAVMGTLAAGETTIAFENRYACKDGAWKVLRWNCAPDPESGLIYASAQDVTDRVTAYQELATSKRRIEQILNLAGEGILEMDLRGQLTYANPVGKQIMGAEGEEIAGRSVWELVFAVELDGTRIPPERSTLARVLRDENTVETSQIVQRRDGSRVAVDATVSPVVGLDGSQQGVVAVIRDATERLRAHALLGEQASALERSNVELQQFAYVASHDLQEPLRKISSYVQILEEDYSDRLDDEGRQYIQYAVDGARRMRQLIEDLLAVARVRVDNMSVTDIDSAELVHDVLDDLKESIHAARASVDVAGLPTVSGDATQLRQIFQNLISNAIKYRGAEPPLVRVEAEATNDGWLFTIADNGVGFSPEHAEKVFGMFQRLVGRSQAPGTGIGLAIVRKAVENHGGQVWAESAPGAGSTFRFTLPDPESPAHSAPQEAAA